MDVNDLLVFVRVVQSGSFSKASRLMGIPKSTVSRRVADLEEELGVPLIHRTTRSLRITDVGEGYFQHGLKIASELEKAELLLTSLQSIPQGVLKITAPTDFGLQFLGKIIADFLRLHPRVSVDLVLTERIVDLIAEGFDLAIRVGQLEDSSLMARKIGDLEMQLFASPEYLKKRGEPKAVNELEKHSCVVFTGDSDSSHWVLQGPKGISKTVQVGGQIRSNHFGLVQEFALRGEGIALLPYFLCGADMKNGKLKPILRDWHWESGPLHAVYPGQKFMLPKVRAFVEYLLLAFKDFKWKC